MSRILGAKKTGDDPAVGANVHTDGNALAYIVGGDVSFAGGGGTDLARGDGSGVALLVEVDNPLTLLASLLSPTGRCFVQFRG